MFASAARVSGQPRVFRPQSGLTHRRFCRNAFCRFLQQGFNPFHARYVWRVNVIDASDRFHLDNQTLQTTPAVPMSEREVSMVMTSASSAAIGTHDVVELAITHVSVDLCVIFRHGGVDTGRPLRPTGDRRPSRYDAAGTFAQRRFINLDAQSLPLPDRPPHHAAPAQSVRRWFHD